MSDASFLPEEEAIPLWRDVRVLRWGFQLLVLGLVVALLIYLYTNLTRSLAAVGLNLSFDFLTRPAGFQISEGPNIGSRSPIWQIYFVGVANTLRASAIGIVLATILGIFVGIGRLSRNWLVSRVSLAFIEVMQNTPLLVQLFFWFVLIRALPTQNPDEIVALPAIGNGLGIEPIAYFSQRAAALPGIELLSPARFWIVLVFGLAVAISAFWWISRLEPAEAKGFLKYPWWVALGAFTLLCLVGWLIGGPALRVSMPSLGSNATGIVFNYEGGWVLSNSFQALLLGLVLYTAAFIAEVVRSGIQAVPNGQIEAATSLGLSRGLQLRLVILPQALRIIIPPLINQYLNLVKNSSLAIAVAYPDLFNVSQTIGNNTGQNVQIIVLVMGTYLIISLSISGLLNVINERMQIKER